MSYFEFLDPLIYLRRRGTAEDPYVSISDTQMIKQNYVLLQEIPDKFNGVTVTGEGVTWIQIQSGSPSENQYKVNWLYGLIEFHPSRNGLSLTFNYMGTGNFFIPSSRIWTQSDGISVTETLKDILDELNVFRDEWVDTIKPEALEVTNNMNTILNNLIHRGTYSDSITYKPFNMVLFQNSTYMAIQETKGNLPTNTTYWKLISLAATMNGTTFNGDITMLSSKGIIFGDRFKVYKNNDTDSLDIDVI